MRSIFYRAQNITKITNQMKKYIHSVSLKFRFVYEYNITEDQVKNVSIFQCLLNIIIRQIIAYDNV